MNQSSDILFGRVNLPLLDKQQAFDGILSVPHEKWFWDDYRATNMLPLMTKGGVGGALGTANSRVDKFEWLDYTPKVITEWFDTVVFPWMGKRTRVMALMTGSYYSNKEHIDCDPHKMGTLQHKFRIVLQGKTSTLYWKTSDGDVYAPEIEEPFIMDGSWPHGMINRTDEVKITLAAGAPWEGNSSYDNVDVLQSKSEYNLPKHINLFFKTPR